MSIADGIPGWRGSLGATDADLVLHNNLNAGGANISILGPGWTQSPIIQGEYFVVLQAGALNGEFVNASLTQAGTTPHDANSLLFQATGNNFVVSFNGTPLPVYDLGPAANSRLYGADISTLRGLPGSLSFASLSLPTRRFNDVGLDALNFSAMTVPEPRLTALLTLIALRFLCARRHPGVVVR